MPILSEKDLEIINKIESQVIGVSMRTDREYIIEKMGKDKLREVEKEMEELGYPLKYEEIKKYQWYPLKVGISFLALSKKMFNWGEDEMWKWGRWAAKVHFLTRIMMAFASKDLLAKNANKKWKKYFTGGDLRFTFKENKGQIELKNFVLHPAHREYLVGYFHQIASLVVPPKNLKVKSSETNQIDYHVFNLTW